MDVKITKIDHGPYVVEGVFTMVDADGNAYEAKESIALCRCGQSIRAPYCDASHNRTRYRENSRAIPEE